MRENKFHVFKGSDGQIGVLRDLKDMSKDDAIELAAWLVAISGQKSLPPPIANPYSVTVGSDGKLLTRIHPGGTMDENAAGILAASLVKAAGGEAAFPAVLAEVQPLV